MLKSARSLLRWCSAVVSRNRLRFVVLSALEEGAGGVLDLGIAAQLGRHRTVERLVVREFGFEL